MRRISSILGRLERANAEVAGLLWLWLGFEACAQVAAPYTDPDNGFVFDGITDPVHSVT